MGHPNITIYELSRLCQQQGFFSQAHIFSCSSNVCDFFALPLAVRMAFFLHCSLSDIYHLSLVGGTLHSFIQANRARLPQHDVKLSIDLKDDGSRFEMEICRASAVMPGCLGMSEFRRPNEHSKMNSLNLELSSTLIERLAKDGETVHYDLYR